MIFIELYRIEFLSNLNYYHVNEHAFNYLQENR